MPRMPKNPCNPEFIKTPEDSEFLHTEDERGTIPKRRCGAPGPKEPTWSASVWQGCDSVRLPPESGRCRHSVRGDAVVRSRSETSNAEPRLRIAGSACTSFG